MFAKPYKLKSNITLKNSEKKCFAQRILNEFPSCSEEKVKELVPVKSTCICMKLVLHSGDSVNVYSVDSVPVIIELREQLLPTVCALWRVPTLVPVLVIHSPVLPKIQGGAPLYMPGVVIPTSGAGFPTFPRNAFIALCTQDNSAVGAVGRALLSSADMLFRNAGVCLETLQVVGDQLCKDNKFSKIDRPKLGPASYDPTESITTEVSKLSIEPVIKEEWPSLGKKSVPPTPAPAPPPAPNEPKLIAADEQPLLDEPPTEHITEDIVTAISEDLPSPEDLGIPSDMDSLLRWCLLSFLKLEAKHSEYPFKTNLLYKCMMQLCPPDLTLDVKKSSYKKVSKFLEAMQSEGLLEVREIERGVSAVTAVTLAHPAVRGHNPGQRRAVPEPAPPELEYEPPLVREVHCVTAALLDVLAPVRKGTPMTAAEVRSRLTEYVKTHNLHAAEQKGAVTLDAALAKLTGKPQGSSVIVIIQEAMKWDALMAGALARMTPGTETRFASGAVTLCRSRLEPVRMQVATRSGNKKVTLVSNLEAFGFNLQALARACQAGVAAACGVTRAPAARAGQLMLQGDQTHFMAKLLIEKYGLPKKYVEGADKALNKKK